MKKSLYFLVIIGLVESSNAFSATASDYYCRAMPSMNPIMYEGGEKTCTDAKGSKTVSTGKTCVENVQCFYLTAFLKSNILDDVNSRNTVKMTDFAKVVEGQKLNFFKKHPVIEGEMTTLICDAEADPADVSAPFKCKRPEKCKGDHFFGATVPDLLHTFDAETTIEFDHNLKSGNFPAVPATDPRPINLPTTKGN
jgi:hypothetical protein